MTEEPMIRPAIVDDADALAQLRREMQTELMANQGGGLRPDDLVDHNRDYFREHLRKDDFASFVVEANGVIVATSGLVIYRVPPTAGNPTGIEGLVLNMYTVPQYRRRGLATRLLDTLVAYARAWTYAACGSAPATSAATSTRATASAATTPITWRTASRRIANEQARPSARSVRLQRVREQPPAPSDGGRGF